MAGARAPLAGSQGSAQRPASFHREEGFVLLSPFAGPEHQQKRMPGLQISLKIKQLTSFQHPASDGDSPPRAESGSHSP